MILYEYSTTRSIRCRWLLQELAVPFESVEVNLTKGEHQSPDFLAINPNAKVPALKDGNLVLFESAAICNYLGDKYSEQGLMPAVRTAERALHDQWTFFCMSELEQPLWAMARHTFIYPEAKRSQAAIDLAAEDFRSVVMPLEQYMRDKSYVLGDKFQVTDIMIGQTLIWAHATRITKPHNLLADCPMLQKYLKLLSQRERMPEDLRKVLLDRLNAV